MAWSLDARIPVEIVTALPPGAADTALLLPEGAVAPPGAAAVGVFGAESHAVGCTCCGGRLPAAVALDGLFLDRVRGRVPFFKRVVALDGGQVARVLAVDAVVGARFRGV